MRLLNSMPKSKTRFRTRCAPATRKKSSERVFEAADRAQRFLSLTAVISLLLSAVAVAMSARRFAQRRMDTVALMKSLGATQRFVLSVSVVQLAMLGVLGVLIGSVVGYGAERLLSGLIGELLQGELPQPGADAGVAGLWQCTDSVAGFRVAVTVATAQYATTQSPASR